MTFKKRYLRLVHLLFIVLLLIQLLPDKLSGDTYAQYVVWFAVGVEILTLIVSSFIKKPIGLTLFVDIVSFIYGLLIAWTLATAKFNFTFAATAAIILLLFLGATWFRRDTWRPGCAPRMLVGLVNKRAKP